MPALVDAMLCGRAELEERGGKRVWASGALARSPSRIVSECLLVS